MGNLIIVDPEANLEPGDCILVALLASKEVLFGRYKPMAESKTGHPPYSLEFDNRFYDTRLITLAHQPVYLGTMVEHIVLASR